MSDPQTILNPVSLIPALEALMFAAPGPITLAQLAVVLDVDVSIVEQGLRAMESQYTERSGLRLQWHSSRVQLTTAPEHAPLIEKFLGLETTSRLSRAALEALSIIAYQQPVTRPQIDAIRGVSSDGVMKSLLSKGLVQEVGRAEAPGRPVLFGTTAEFLQYFGLSSIQELPPLEAVDQPAGSEPEIKILKG